jgi:hypothetical protein
MEKLLPLIVGLVVMLGIIGISVFAVRWGAEVIAACGVSGVGIAVLRRWGKSSASAAGSA